MIEVITPAQRAAHIERLLAIWQSAVRATHTFLSEEDIRAIAPEVPQAIMAVEHLCCFTEEGVAQGFIGVQDGKIEMLFVDAPARGRGIGKALVRFARSELNAQCVDVNEQNEQGVGFYAHMGFKVISRSALDEQGRPFPILHLK